MIFNIEFFYSIYNLYSKAPKKKKKKEEVDSSKKMYAPWISLSNIESNLVKPSQSC